MATPDQPQLQPDAAHIHRRIASAAGKRRDSFLREEERLGKARVKGRHRDEESPTGPAGESSSAPLPISPVVSSEARPYDAWDQAEVEDAQDARRDREIRRDPREPEQDREARREPSEARRDSSEADSERSPSLAVGVVPPSSPSSITSKSSDETSAGWLKLIFDIAEATDRRGPDFLEWLKQKRKDAPEYEFLFPGNKGHEHFRQLLATFAGYE